MPSRPSGPSTAPGALVRMEPGLVRRRDARRARWGGRAGSGRRGGARGGLVVDGRSAGGGGVRLPARRREPALRDTRPARPDAAVIRRADPAGDPARAPSRHRRAARAGAGRGHPVAAAADHLEHPGRAARRAAGRRGAARAARRRRRAGRRPRRDWCERARPKPARCRSACGARCGGRPDRHAGGGGAALRRGRPAAAAARSRTPVRGARPWRRAARRRRAGVRGRWHRTCTRLAGPRPGRSGAAPRATLLAAGAALRGHPRQRRRRG